MRYATIILLVALSGCGWFTKPDPVVVYEQQCESLRIVPFPDYMLEPIDIEPLKNIQLTFEEEPTSRVCMSFDDFREVMLLMRDTSSYIENQNIIIRKMRDFYEQGLDREGLDQ